MHLPLNQLHPRAIAARLSAMIAPTPGMDSASTVFLALHGVTQDAPIQMNTRFISANRLAADIRALRRIPGLRFVSLEDAMNPEVPGPKVTMTFDDGLRCLLPNMLPVLEAENVPATLYITTLDAHAPAAHYRRMLWADRIDLAAHLRHPAFGVGDEVFRLDARRIWRRDGDGVHLKNLCIQRDISFVDAVAMACDPGETLAPYWQLLSASELRRLSDHPLITLGAHGVTHANLPSLTPDEKHYELTASKTWLENCLQHEITTFAFPHGFYTSDCLTQARKAGYRLLALSDYNTAADAAAPDLFRRIGNHPRCGSLVQRRVIASGGYGHETYR